MNYKNYIDRINEKKAEIYAMEMMRLSDIWMQVAGQNTPHAMMGIKMVGSTEIQYWEEPAPTSFGLKVASYGESAANEVLGGFADRMSADPIIDKMHISVLFNNTNSSVVTKNTHKRAHFSVAYNGKAYITNWDMNNNEKLQYSMYMPELASKAKVHTIGFSESETPKDDPIKGGEDKGDEKKK